MKDDTRKRKEQEVDASDDTLGENTEQTPLAKEVEQDREEKNANSERKG